MCVLGGIRTLKSSGSARSPKLLCLWPELDWHFRLRKPMLYPLSYKGLSGREPDALSVKLRGPVDFSQGGGNRIRTCDRLTAIIVFETIRLNRSRIPPVSLLKRNAFLFFRPRRISLGLTKPSH